MQNSVTCNKLQQHSIVASFELKIYKKIAKQKTNKYTMFKIGTFMERNYFKTMVLL